MQRRKNHPLASYSICLWAVSQTRLWPSCLCLPKLAVDAGPSCSQHTPANAQFQILRAHLPYVTFGPSARAAEGKAACSPGVRGRVGLDAAQK